MSNYEPTLIQETVRSQAARLNIFGTHFLIETIEFLLQKGNRCAVDNFTVRADNFRIEDCREGVHCRHKEAQRILLGRDQRNHSEKS